MTTRCKFKCVETKQGESWNTAVPVMYGAKFQPVGGDSPENKEFWLATPSGSLELGTIKSCPFEVGKQYYIDITLAE